MPKVMVSIELDALLMMSSRGVEIATLGQQVSELVVQITRLAHRQCADVTAALKVEEKRLRPKLPPPQGGPA